MDGRVVRKLLESKLLQKGASVKPLFILTFTVALVIVPAARPAVADTYYDKLGVYDHDIDAYKSTSIAVCRTVQHENPDFMKPPANTSALKHLVRLYAACQHSLVHAHTPIGVLRVNNIGFGATCMALAVVDNAEPLMSECNEKSYLPAPN
jgi:hypothetical protein